ncbi:glycosyltransferase [Paenibacillus aestuarii]|uniref:Glycosyltransferase n=1 Tax=Paenibacillus aestuarii TaxID=516965 RepID=A0ABW0K0R5_9BACL|nr:glycosyltransferase [Paenibacillus aestuarii]
MKKVLIVVPHLRTGGGQKVALDVAIYMKNPNVNVQLLSLYSNENTIFDQLAHSNNIKVKYLKKKSGMDLGVITEIWKELRKFKPDVVHAHLRVLPYLILPMIYEKVPKRFYTVHNLAHKDASGFMRMLLKFSFHFARVTPVAISDLCKKSISQVYSLPEEKIPCIYNGIDVESYSNNQDEKNDKNGTFVLIATGRFYHQKNHLLMIDAFKEIHNKIPNTQLVLLGDGEIRSELQERVRSYNLETSVIFKGLVSNVAEELGKSDIYIMSSNWEGLPLSVLEAMAAGLPIVSTKAGGVIDVIEDDVNGYLVDIGDKEGLVNSVLKLIHSPQKLVEMASNSKKMARKYDVSVCVKGHEELYLHS